jgi:hypothetical protein
MVDYRETFFNVLNKDENFTNYLSKYNFNNHEEVKLPQIESKSRQKSYSTNQFATSLELKTSLNLRKSTTNLQQDKLISTHSPSTLLRNKQRKGTNLSISKFNKA